jgi:hypothetical protein
MNAATHNDCKKDQNDKSIKIKIFHFLVNEKSLYFHENYLITDNHFITNDEKCI